MKQVKLSYAGTLPSVEKKNTQNPPELKEDLEIKEEIEENDLQIQELQKQLTLIQKQLEKTEQELGDAQESKDRAIAGYKKDMGELIQDLEKFESRIKQLEDTITEQNLLIAKYENEIQNLKLVNSTLDGNNVQLNVTNLENRRTMESQKEEIEKLKYLVTSQNEALNKFRQEIDQKNLELEAALNGDNNIIINEEDSSKENLRKAYNKQFIEIIAAKTEELRQVFNQKHNEFVDYHNSFIANLNNKVNLKIRKLKTEAEKVQETFNALKKEYDETIDAYNQLLSSYEELTIRYNKLKEKREKIQDENLLLGENVVYDLSDTLKTDLERAENENAELRLELERQQTEAKKTEQKFQEIILNNKEEYEAKNRQGLAETEKFERKATAYKTRNEQLKAELRKLKRNTKIIKTNLKQNSTKLSTVAENYITRLLLKMKN